MTYHRTIHTVPCEKAIDYIKSHGANAMITVEGILAISDSVYTDGREDRLVEDMAVFPLDDDGRASSRAIRSWLGY